MTVGVFAPVRDFDFVTYDDLEFVAENPHVTTGLTAGNVRWAFADAYAGAGGPLTWISHMLDVEMFGISPGAHHVTNLVIHVCNAVLLLIVLHALTGSVGRSAFVAALFAVHPLHVESVAWIAERKDVLSTMFWLLAVWAYVAYVRQRRASRYALVALCLTLGLLSKPMVATLPLLLLLLDLWPLERITAATGSWREVRWLILEKIPLAVLSIVAVTLAFVAQRRIGAVAGFERLPLSVRLGNAAVSVVSYIGACFWPARLAAFYPYRELGGGLVAGSVIALVALTAVGILLVRRAPYVTVSWLWFVTTLVPVIGIVQVGGHAMADRFTYVPLVGLFILLAWGGAAVLEGAGLRPSQRAAVALPILLACGIVARAQAMNWRNGVALWEHAIEVAPDNARAHANLGVSIAREGHAGQAIDHYREALRLQPGDAYTHNNLALALVEQGKGAEALAHYQEAVRLAPEYANAHNNLANLLADQDRYGEALEHHREAIRLEPDAALNRVNLAITLGHMGRPGEAIPLMLDAIRANPDQAEWHYVVAALFAQNGQPQEAVPHLETALRLNPSHEAARLALKSLVSQP